MTDTTKMDELKAEAVSLGITHKANIGESKLQEKIEQHYAEQETSSQKVSQLVKANEKAVVGTGAVGGIDPKESARRLKIANRSKAARETRVIKIVDNDQRQNNHTSTCVVNCSNEYFDLGTRVLPLNENIEVAQGHIDVLKEVKITLHTKNTKTGLSVAKTRNRYSISTEDV